MRGSHGTRTSPASKVPGPTERPIAADLRHQRLFKRYGGKSVLRFTAAHSIPHGQISGEYPPHAEVLVRVRGGGLRLALRGSELLLVAWGSPGPRDDWIGGDGTELAPSRPPPTSIDTPCTGICTCGARGSSPGASCSASRSTVISRADRRSYEVFYRVGRPGSRRVVAIPK